MALLAKLLSKLVVMRTTVSEADELTTQPPLHHRVNDIVAYIVTALIKPICPLNCSHVGYK